MKASILIDAIVRHTTVLIARLSTAEGARSPLGHIANEVFAGLAQELEAQGVSHKVIADMFGMALRSYRQKTQRVGESKTSRGQTLWSAVLDHLSEDNWTNRADVFERFKYDSELSVRGILKDLVDNGFVIRLGKGDSAEYRLATKAELRDFGAGLEGDPGESLAALVWLQIYREGPLSRQDLLQLVPVSQESLDTALGVLTAAARVRGEEVAGELTYSAEQLLLPLGEPAGWEAAVVDHHRTVLNALAAKITGGTRTTARSDEMGGSTFSFTLWPGHPMEEEIRSHLADTRTRLLPVWDRLVKYNEEHPKRSEEYEVNYYFGQYIVEEEELE